MSSIRPNAKMAKVRGQHVTVVERRFDGIQSKSSALEPHLSGQELLNDSKRKILRPHHSPKVFRNSPSRGTPLFAGKPIRGAREAGIAWQVYRTVSDWFSTMYDAGKTIESHIHTIQCILFLIGDFGTCVQREWLSQPLCMI